MDIHQVELPSSKSISNRLLIIKALGNLKKPIHHLSDSDDTQNLQKALDHKAPRINVGEGGTTLRFVLSYFCLINEGKILDGTGNLRSRPLNPLTQVLQKMGCLFAFENKEFELPIEILSGVNKDHSELVQIDSSISSQFVSSILLIAPYFNKGLKLCWTADGVSEPYIQMTLQLMQLFGIQISKEGKILNVKPGSYSDLEYTVEADWSAAAFILAWMALQEKSMYFFPNLQRSGLQADEVVLDFLQHFGVTTASKENGLLIEKKPKVKPRFLKFDFTNCPDLFPVLAIYCALQKVNVQFKGLQHLVHKESNRLQIINDFLLHCNVNILEIQPGREMYFEMQNFQLNKDIHLDSHHDHRIAMAFSLLYKITDVSISNPHVVSKSFPAYWEVFEKIRMRTG